MWRLIAQSCSADPSRVPRHHLRLFRSGASRLPHVDAERLAALFGCTVLPTYSMTECMPIATPPLAYRLEKPESVGVAADGIEIAILQATGDWTTGSAPLVAGEESDTPLPSGQVGEVALRDHSAGTLFDGYDSDPPHARDAWFRTGDLGLLDDAACLTITGRRREMINRGGELLAPGPLEETLQRHPNVPMGGGQAPTEPTQHTQGAAASPTPLIATDCR